MPKHINEPEGFYAELLHTETDPFSDLSIEIEDDHENADYDQIQGLSDEQVSQIALDALEQARDERLYEHDYSDNNPDSRP